MLTKTLIIICLFFAVRVSYGSDWPQYQHDAARSGYSPDTIPSMGGRILWRFHPGGATSASGRAQPVVKAGILCFYNGRLFGIDAATGTKKWFVAAGMRGLTAAPWCEVLGPNRRNSILTTANIRYLPPRPRLATSSKDSVIGFKMLTANPPGQSTTITYAKPAWLSSSGDSLFGRGPAGTASEDSVTAVLSVGATAYDTLTVRIVFDDFTVTSCKPLVMAAIPNNAAELRVRTSAHLIHIDALVTQPGMFTVSLHDVSGKTVWEKQGTAARAGWISAAAVLSRPITMQMLLVLMRQQTGVACERVVMR